MSARAAVALQQPGLATRQQAAVSRLCGPAAHHRPSGWPGAAPWPQQCRQQAVSQSSSRQPRRGAPPCSSASGPSQLAYEAGGDGSSGGGGGHHAHAGGGLDSGTRTLSDVIDWTINLPWQKAFSWVVVAVAASQLRDFFGVRPPAAAADRQPWSSHQCAHCPLPAAAAIIMCMHACLCPPWDCMDPRSACLACQQPACMCMHVRAAPAASPTGLASYLLCSLHACASVLINQSACPPACPALPTCSPALPACPAHLIPCPARLPCPPACPAHLPALPCPADHDGHLHRVLHRQRLRAERAGVDPPHPPLLAPGACQHGWPGRSSHRSMTRKQAKLVGRRKAGDPPTQPHLPTCLPVPACLPPPACLCPPCRTGGACWSCATTPPSSPCSRSSVCSSSQMWCVCMHACMCCACVCVCMNGWVCASARARALHAPASASSAPLADPSRAAQLLTCSRPLFCLLFASPRPCARPCAAGA